MTNGGKGSIRVKAREILPLIQEPCVCRVVLNPWEDKINLEQVSLLHYSLISSSANGDGCRVLFRTKFMNVYKIFRIVPGM